MKSQQGSGSPVSSCDSDHHSDLTDSTEGDENLIALLQFKDAYHILNISPQESPYPIPPETIRTAYDSAKKKVLAALDQFEASEKQSDGRSTLLVSQQNYLELKLQALGQAYEELMPMDLVRDVIDESFKQRLATEAPSVETRQYFWNDASTAAVKSIISKEATNKLPTNQQHRRVPSEDELDTIDIYFRPSPGHSKSSDAGRPKSPGNGNSSDVSSCTWDGSSIFSIVSRTKQNIEEVSVGGLSDVLGPIYNSTPCQSGSAPSLQEKHTHRPPSGISSKQGRPKAQISPRSVTDFPASIHNMNHYDKTSNFNTGKVVVGEGKMMKGSRDASSHHISNEATEAARMGILRALSEDNSECLPLDDDNDHNCVNVLNVSNDTHANSDKCQFMSVGSSNNERGFRPRTFFQGKSDQMPKESNSIMASVVNEKQIDHPASCQRNTALIGVVSSKSTSPSIEKQNKDEITTPVPQPNSHDGLLQSGEYSYGDALLQSGMELADELCMALGSCWNGVIGYPAVASASSETDHACLREDESTHFTRSTLDDSVYHAQGDGTATEEPTSFNSTSSFSRQAGSSNLTRSRKISRPRNPSPVAPTMSDPPPRMLV